MNDIIRTCNPIVRYITSLNSLRTSLDRNFVPTCLSMKDISKVLSVQKDSSTIVFAPNTKLLYQIYKIWYILWNLNVTLHCLKVLILNVQIFHLVICDENCPHIKILCTLNIHYCVHCFKIFIYWIYKIVYILWKIMYLENTKFFTFLKSLNIKYKPYTLNNLWRKMFIRQKIACIENKKLHALDIRNCVHCLKKKVI